MTSAAVKKHPGIVWKKTPVDMKLDRRASEWRAKQEEAQMEQKATALAWLQSVGTRAL